MFKGNLALQSVYQEDPYTLKQMTPTILPTENRSWPLWIFKNPGALLK